MTQSMISDSVQRLFAGLVNTKTLLQMERDHWPDELWKITETSGYADVLVPQNKGGFGGSFLDAYEILRSAGAHSLPLPLAETIVARYMLSNIGMDVPQGPITMIEQGRQSEIELMTVGNVLQVKGKAISVPWARWCDWLMVHASLKGSGVLALIQIKDQAKVSITKRENIAKEPRDDIVFDGVVCSAYAPITHSFTEPIWRLGALTRSMQIVGALEASFDMSLTYVSQREQFGKPLGNNQAVQQMLAVMASETAAAKMATQVAAMCTSDTTALFDIAVAKVRSGEAAGRAAAIAHQVHGAMGTTQEYGLNFLTRRLWSWRREFGSDAHWAEKLGSATIAAGSENFWFGLTSRSIL